MITKISMFFITTEIQRECCFVVQMISSRLSTVSGEKIELTG